MSAKTYTVKVQRVIVQETTIEVDAENGDEAGVKAVNHAEADPSTSWSQKAVDGPMLSSVALKE